MDIDAQGVYYKELNESIHQAVREGNRDIVLENVNGQRYIGDSLSGDMVIKIKGTPGNDMAAFYEWASLGSVW